MASKQKDLGASLLEFAVLVALVAAIVVLPVRSAAKHANCKVYVSNCGVSVQAVPGAFTCWPKQTHPITTSSAQACVDFTKTSCESGVFD